MLIKRSAGDGEANPRRGLRGIQAGENVKAAD